jgi:hypothetical protein
MHFSVAIFPASGMQKERLYNVSGGYLYPNGYVFTVSNFSLPVRAYISVKKEPEIGNYAVRRYLSIENMKPLRGFWKVDNNVSLDMYALTGNG